MTKSLLRAALAGAVALAFAPEVASACGQCDCDVFQPWMWPYPDRQLPTNARFFISAKDLGPADFALVQLDGGAVVPTHVEPSAAAHGFWLVPDSELAPYTEYRVTRTDSGTPGFPEDFLTASGPDVTPPDPPQDLSVQAPPSLLCRQVRGVMFTKPAYNFPLTQVEVAAPEGTATLMLPRPGTVSFIVGTTADGGESCLTDGELPFRVSSTARLTLRSYDSAGNPSAPTVLDNVQFLDSQPGGCPNPTPGFGGCLGGGAVTAWLGIALGAVLVAKRRRL